MDNLRRDHLVEYYADRVPATEETFAQMSRGDRSFYVARVRSGMPAPTELAARCMRNEGLRNPCAGGGNKCARVEPLPAPANRPRYHVDMYPPRSGRIPVCRAVVQTSAAEVSA
jgi:hypothetical protein